MKKRFTTGIVHWTVTDTGYKVKLLIIMPFVTDVLYAVSMLNSEMHWFFCCQYYYIIVFFVTVKLVLLTSFHFYSWCYF